MTTYRVAVIGCGNRSRAHLRADQLIEGLELVACCDPIADRRESLAYGRFLLGNPRVIQVGGNAYSWDMGDATHPAPEATEAHLVFENGVRGLWTLGPISPHIGDPATTWQHVRVAAYADRGRVNYEEFGQWEIVSPRGVERGEFGGMDICGKVLLKPWE